MAAPVGSSSGLQLDEEKGMESLPRVGAPSSADAMITVYGVEHRACQCTDKSGQVQAAATPMTRRWPVAAHASSHD